jgi:arylsulfatase A-like enzyme
VLPLAILVAILASIALDLRAELAASSLLFGAGAAAGLPGLAPWVTSAWLRDRTWRGTRVVVALSGALAAVPPGIVGVPRLVRIYPEPAFWALPVVVLSILLVIALGVVASWRGWVASTSRAIAIATASAMSGAVLVFVHLGEGTLLNLRPETGALHVALFVGTLFATVPSVVLVASAASGDALPTPRLAHRLLLATPAAGLGAGMLLADRVQLVDSYPYVHAWLACTGIGLLAAGALHALPPRVHVPLRASAALSVFLVASAASAVWLGRSASPITRAALDDAPVGRVALDALWPAYRRPPVLGDAPLLHVDQRLEGRKPDVRPDILLVTVDALRADQLEGAFPSLRALRDRSVRFERAYSPASRTAMAVGALQLGVYPANIDWVSRIYRGGGKLYDPAMMSQAEIDALRGKFVYTTIPGPGGKMLPERLKAAGYRTMATAYAGRNEFFREDGAFDRGWDDFEDMADREWKAPTSARVVKAALKQHDRVTKRGSRPWFQWIHLYDPHEAGSSKPKYERMVRAFDDALEQLMAGLEKRDALARTVVVLAADHGEAFGEHRHHTHGSSLYDEQLRIPLLFVVPGQPARTLPDVVSLVDVTATIAVAARADTTGLDGTNLWPTILGSEPVPRRPIFLQLHRYLSNRGGRTTDLVGVLLDDHKLVVDRRRGTARLFDLASDPAEAQNVLGADPERGAELQSLADAFFGRAETAHPLP